MVLEIERKFLIDNESILDEFTLDDINFQLLKVEQFYTQITKFDERRYRKSSKSYFFTYKKGKGISRVENEHEITKKEFKRAKELMLGSLISKDRYLFKINNLPCNIDIYSGDLSGIIVLEIEFLTIDDANNFKIPNFLQKHILKEITYDDEYKNKNLALFGNPDAGFDVEKSMDILDKVSPLLQNLVFPDSINAMDGVRVSFYYLFKLIQHYKNDYLKTFNDESMHQFRVNLRKSRSLLKLVGSVFDQDITKHFCDEFKKLANSTNKIRDIDVFLNFIDNSDEYETHKAILRNSKNRQITQFKQILEDSEILFEEWSMLLRENSDFYKGINHDKKLKKLVSKALRIQMVKLQKRLFNLNSDCKNSYFHKIRIEFKKFRYLADMYKSFYKDEKLLNCILKSKEAQELFGNLQDRDVLLSMIDELENHDNNDLSELKSKFKKDIINLRDEILRKKDKLRKRFLKSSKIIKIYT